MAYRLIGDIMKKRRKREDLYHHPKLALADTIMELEFFVVSGMTCNRLETDPKIHEKSVEGPYSNVCLLMKKLRDGQVLPISLVNPGGKPFGALARLRLSWL